MNNRIIKFRAWNKTLRLMQYGENAQGLFLQKATEAGYPVMQFTGLTDKNGKEIYENDLVTMHQFLFDGNEVESQIFGVVGYSEESACFTLERIKSKFYEDYTGYKPSEGTNNICDFYGLHEESWEVMGNIWENPELLK